MWRYPCGLSPGRAVLSTSLRQRVSASPVAAVDMWVLSWGMGSVVTVFIKLPLCAGRKTEIRLGLVRDVCICCPGIYFVIIS